MSGRPKLERRITSLRALIAGATLCLLTGCAVLSGPQKDPATVYAPDPRITAAADWPRVQWQLSLNHPTATRMLDSQRIAVRPSPNELQVYKGAMWAKAPADMLEDSLLRALEDSGRIAAVARQGSGIGADYKLVLDVRRFESDYAGSALPSATIEVSAKLLNTQGQSVIASRTFRAAQPAASTAVTDVVDAFERALASITTDLAGWTLSSGAAHSRSARR